MKHLQRHKLYIFSVLAITVEANKFCPSVCVSVCPSIATQSSLSVLKLTTLGAHVSYCCTLSRYLIQTCYTGLIMYVQYVFKISSKSYHCIMQLPWVQSVEIKVFVLRLAVIGNNLSKPINMKCNIGYTLHHSILHHYTNQYWNDKNFRRAESRFRSRFIVFWQSYVL